jgi:hypothetical protein
MPGWNYMVRLFRPYEWGRRKRSLTSTLFWFLAMLCVARIPLVFLMKQNQPAGEIHAH